MKPRYRLATDALLTSGAVLTLEGNPAHYLTHVLRLTAGDEVALFSRAAGEWRSTLCAFRKKSVELVVGEPLRPPERPTGLTVCFAPIRGGRLETIIEKATELGADTLQPVMTRRTVVTRINRERLESIAREAAEQCERTGWPEIREPVKLEKLLGAWPGQMPLIYGDEMGKGRPIGKLLQQGANGSANGKECIGDTITIVSPMPMHSPKWAILAGPEGGFAPEELATLRHCAAAIGVSLGPRILRADTAIITLCALTLGAWGDWDQPPRFMGDDSCTPPRP